MIFVLGLLRIPEVWPPIFPFKAFLQTTHCDYDPSTEVNWLMVGYMKLWQPQSNGINYVFGKML